MKSEDASSAPSTPETPEITPPPLFGYGGGAFEPSEIDGNSTRSPLLRNGHCFGFKASDMEEGNLSRAPCLFLPSPISLARKVGAEFIGTLILIFGGTAAAIVNQEHHGSETLIGLAASSGLAIMIVILATSHISGAHLNPALTIAFAALRHFPWKYVIQVPVYIGAQVGGSLCAAFALKWIFHPTMGGGVTLPSGDDYGQAFVLEFIISFNLMFVVTAVATDTRAERNLAGIAVGATVMLNILIAGETTGASMNPVRTLAPAVAAGNYRGIWIYLTAPIFGALCGGGTYTAVKLPKKIEIKSLQQPTVSG